MRFSSFSPPLAGATHLFIIGDQDEPNSRQVTTYQAQTKIVMITPQINIGLGHSPPHSPRGQHGAGCRTV